MNESKEFSNRNDSFLKSPKVFFFLIMYSMLKRVSQFWLEHVYVAASKSAQYSACHIFCQQNNICRLVIPQNVKKSKNHCTLM
jgi:hypothetical protein